MERIAAQRRYDSSCIRGTDKPEARGSSDLIVFGKDAGTGWKSW